MNLFPTLMTCAALWAAGVAQADLIPPEGQRLVLPIALIDDRPFLAARANGVEGLVLFDTGTPFAILLNRAFVPLDAGSAMASGTAASGQAVVLRRHRAPPGLRIAGQDIAPTGPLLSADLDFVARGMGLALIGFVGAPMVAGAVFGLDYDRGRLLLLRAQADGGLARPPAPSDILAEVALQTGEGDLPQFAGAVGGRPVQIDLDTGDGTTLYLSPATRATWQAAGLLTGGAGNAVLQGLSFGGADFAPLPVQLVEAGSAADHRPGGPPDLLRLGGRFLRLHPTLWNFPAQRFTVLRRGSRYFDD